MNGVVDVVARGVAAQARDSVRHQRRNELVSAAIKVASVHPGTHSILGKPQRVIWEFRHDQRRTSLVLVTRTQVQPVSLQTRSSPAPGEP
jgi:hypothetical protein